MSSSLFVGVVSVVPTRRRRFLWAAWWSAPPADDPFRKPDASSGGARSIDEALRDAERAAGRSLVAIDGRWAGAWSRVLRGAKPFPKRVAKEADARPAATPRRGSRVWAFALLELAEDAGEDDVKRSFRARALEAHPDRGGDDARFVALKLAYDVALAAAVTPKKRRRSR